MHVTQKRAASSFDQSLLYLGAPTMQAKEKNPEYNFEFSNSETDFIFDDFEEFTVGEQVKISDEADTFFGTGKGKRMRNVSTWPVTSLM